MDFSYRHILRIGLGWLCLLFSQVAQAQEDFTATFSGDPCGPLTVTYTPVTDGSRTVSGYLWDLGNGNTSTLETPSASYVTAQTYDISLTISYADGSETVTKADFVEIFASPEVVFTSDIQGGCSPLTVTFTDQSVAPPGASITTRLWEFEGGGSATGATEAVTFTDPGAYDVTLYVETDQGCSQSVNVTDYIRTENQVAPSFTPTSIRTSCDPSLSVDFANTTPNTDGGNYLFDWDFGDGNTSTDVAPSHTYTTPGVYTVSLTLEETESGCVGGTETRVDMVELADYQMGFSANVTSGCEPLTVSFADTSSVQLPSQTLIWNFGDGSLPLVGTGTGNIRTPSHTYTAPGTYTVLLLIDDASGSCEGSVSISGLVTVESGLAASFTADEDRFCEDTFTVNFTNTSEPAVDYLWDFGDGDTSTQEDPSHTFVGYGTYLVSLTATAANGCTDTYVDTVFAQPILADFVATDDSGCAPITTDLINTTTSITPIVGYAWEVRDSTNVLVFSSTDENPTGAVLPTAGDYTVSLVVTGTSGCTDTAVQVLTAGLPPLSMAFTASDTAICNGETVLFTNGTVEDPANPFPVTYDWRYVQGSAFVPGTPRDGSNLYANLDSGYYDVTLRYESNGCRVTLQRDDYIYVSTPTARFQTTTDLCTPDSLWIENQSVGENRWQWLIQDTTATTTYLNDSVNRDLAISLSAGEFYLIILSVFNDSVGCSDVFVEQLQMPDSLPGFFIGITEDTVCVDQTLTVGSAGVADNYFWTFTLDSTTQVTATGDTITPFFDTPGLYDLTLELTINGCVLDTTWQDAFRIADPLVRIGADTLQGCAPLTVNFFDNSVSDVPIVSYLWTLGSDTLSTDSAFQYTFDSAQNPQRNPYIVSLTLVTADSCTSTRSVDVRVTDPQASFLIDSLFTCDGVAVTLTADGTAAVLYPDPLDDSTTYVWSTNAPGITFDPDNPVQTALYPNGTWDIELTLKDINGCTDNINQSIVVNRELPQANFTADPTEVFCPPAPVNFFDASVAGNAGIAAWDWSFGDGSTATIEDPVRIFREPGLYDVTLVITDSAGCQDTLTRTGYVDIQGPEGSFTVDDSLGYAPLPIQFTGTSPDTGVSFLWDFANGQVEGFFEDSTYLYTYPSGGLFNPVMTIRDSRGCDYAPDPVISIEVLDCPLLDLGSDLVACTQEGDLQLDGFDTTHNITLGTLHYLWNTGDTTSSIEPPVMLGTQEYSLDLWIIDDEGARVCELSDTVAVTYAATPVASFTVTNACLGEQSLFESTSTIAAGQIVSYSWDADGDGTPELNGSESNVAFTYQSLGTFTPMLVVESDSGCTDTAQVMVNVLEVPSSTVAATSVCLNDANTLSVAVSLGPGQSVMDYAWDADADGITDQNGATLDEIEVMRDSASLYQAYVHITSDNGCVATDTLDYEVFPLPAISFAPDPALVCSGDAITVQAFGANTYQWAAGSTTDSLTITPTQDTTYYAVTGTSNQGCLSTDSVPVIILNHPFMIPEVRACVGDTLVLNATIPGLETIHTWSTGATDSLLYVTMPGIYSVITEVTETGLACQIQTSSEAFFEEATEIPLSDVTVCFDDVPEVILEPNLTGSFLWEPDGITAPTFSATGPDTVRLVFTNALGCVSDTVIHIIEDCIPRVSFPNAFTPDGDGLNDILLPTGQYFINYRVEIFNRWGEVVFVSDDPAVGWNGLDARGFVHPATVYLIVVSYESQFDPGVRITQRQRVWLVE